jgi:preprotein translocase subunit SecA
MQEKIGYCTCIKPKLQKIKHGMVKVESHDSVLPKYCSVCNRRWDPVQSNAPVQPQVQKNIYVAADKIGRNDSCPCGSGLKYKKCCIPTEKRRLRINMGNV